MSIRLILPLELPRFEEHLLRLSPADRRLRFECATGDASIQRYVSGIDLSHDVVFGHFDGSALLRGAAHVSLHRGVAELGLSVEESERGKGVGTRLLKRAAAWSRFGAGRLTSQCLTENRWMMSRVRTLGFSVERDHETALASLVLEPADAGLMASALLDEQLGWWAWGLERSRSGSARALSRSRA